MRTIFLALLSVVGIASAGAQPAPAPEATPRALRWTGGLGYTYDGAGNIKRIGTDVQVYDAVGRLIRSDTNGIRAQLPLRRLRQPAGLHRRERDRLPVRTAGHDLPESAEQWLPEVLRRTGFEVAEIGLAAALRVRALPWHHRDPFDRLLIAHALEDGYTIITHDATLATYGVPILRA